MRELVRRVRSVLLFLLIPALAAASPLLMYPAITRQFGAAGFAAVAVGQSSGAAVAIVCEIGWSVVGPQLVAGSNLGVVSRIHRTSVATKLTALALGLPVAVAASAIVATNYELTAAAVGASVALTALSPMWLLIGLNRPYLILAAEVVPRMLFNVCAAIAIDRGAPLVSFAVVNVASVFVTLFVVRRRAGIAIVPTRGDYRAGFRTIRQQFQLTVGRSVTVVYTALLTSIVGAMLPAAVPLYAATDRILRMGLTILAGLPARLQSWLGEAVGADRRRRSLQVITTNAVLGIVAGITFFFVTDLAARILFANSISIPNDTAALGALVALVICCSRGLGLVLVAYGKANTIAHANLLAATVGLITALLTIPSCGANGGLLAALLAEVVGVVWQGGALGSGRRTWFSPDRTSALPATGAES